VTEAAAVPQAELGALLRRKGVHEAQLVEWRAAAMAGLQRPSRRERKAANLERLKILGWDVHEAEASELAASLIERIRGEAGRIDLTGWGLHSDNGSPMKGATMLATLQRLGVVPSFIRPSVSDDNPYSEALFRTLKYCPEYPSTGFASVADARAWVARFVAWYNHEHQHSGIGYVAPADRHDGKDVAILAARKAVYERACDRPPSGSQLSRR